MRRRPKWYISAVRTCSLYCPQTLRLLFASTPICWTHNSRRYTGNYRRTGNCRYLKHQQEVRKRFSPNREPRQARKPAFSRYGIHRGRFRVDIRHRQDVGGCPTEKLECWGLNHVEPVPIFIPEVTCVTLHVTAPNARSHVRTATFVT
jgi:hypothetical protein